MGRRDQGGEYRDTVRPACLIPPAFSTIRAASLRKYLTGLRTAWQTPKNVLVSVYAKAKAIHQEQQQDRLCDRSCQLCQD